MQYKLDDECEGVVEGGALEGAEMEVEVEEAPVREWRGGGGVLLGWGRVRSREEALGGGGATWRGGGGAIG